MKWLVFAVLLAVPQSPAADDLKYNTVGWLEMGVRAMIACKNHPTDDNVREALTFLSYYDGFMLGLNSSIAFGAEGGLMPPDKFSNAANAAPLLLAFIEEHRRFAPPERDAKDVLIGWYLMSHPEATPKQRLLGALFLNPSGAKNLKKP